MKKEEAQKLADQALLDLEQALKSGHSESFLRYLDVMSRFHRYSFGNCMLIGLQKPDATYVAGFRTWLQLGRHVRKGETGIGILAPLIYRKKQEQTTEEEQTTTLRGFKVVHVFDVSQTDGAELPNFASVTGTPGEMLNRLEQVIQAGGIVLSYEALPQGTKGESRKGAIAISENLTDAERFSVLAHELAHEWMHDAIQRQGLSKTVRETEAEAVSYVVCQTFGLDCSTHSADYIQLYRGTAQTLSESLERIQKTAMRIIDAVQEATAKEERHVA